MRVITGTARGMTLKAPKGMDTRPTMDQVKEGIFSAIQFEVEGRRALDLFAGSGQLGIEALSRGAREAVFVDARRDACQVVRENLTRRTLPSVRRWCRWTIYRTLARGADGSTSCFSTRPTQKFFWKMP